jgi:phosphoribosylformylglycinamidine synthase
MRIKGTQRGLAMALDGNGRWCYLNPKLGAQHAVAEAARNVACTGATPVAATNCLNFGNPEKPPIMRQFSDVVDGITEACTALATPITGGNVSLYNETLGEGIYPTPVVGIVGIIEDVRRSVKSAFVGEGDDILLLSTAASSDTEQTFGSSEYAKEVLGAVWGAPPALDLAQEAALQKAIIEMIAAGAVKSAHDCSDGGLAVALSECAFKNNIGVTVDLNSPQPLQISLFGEAASRILISCDPSQRKNIEQVAAKHNVLVSQLGTTSSNSLEISVNGKTAIHAPISELKSAWAGALEEALGVTASLEITA